MSDDVQTPAEEPTDEELARLQTLGVEVYEQFIQDSIEMDWAYKTGRLEEWIEKKTASLIGERPSGTSNPFSGRVESD